jgi:hypothetical protein
MVTDAAMLIQRARCLAEVEQSLKDVPPVSFDVARQVRLFEPCLQYVDLNLTRAAKACKEFQAAGEATSPVALGSVSDLTRNVRCGVGGRRDQLCTSEAAESSARITGAQTHRAYVASVRKAAEKRSLPKWS